MVSARGGKAHLENKPTAVYNYDLAGIWSSMSEAEQNLGNAVLMYGCSEFFKHNHFFYIFESKKVYIKAMTNFLLSPEETFIKNKECICRLAVLLMTPQKTFLTSVLKFFISFIPDKKLRKRFKKRLSF